MKFATLLTPSSVYMSRTPFTKIPQWAQWFQRKWNITGRRSTAATRQKPGCACASRCWCSLFAVCWEHFVREEDVNLAASFSWKGFMDFTLPLLCYYGHLLILGTSETYSYKPGHNISYKIACVPSEDSDQPAHPRSLIRVFTGHSLGSQGSKASSGGQRRLWSDCADVQADLSSLGELAIVLGILFPGSYHIYCNVGQDQTP